MGKVKQANDLRLSGLIQNHPFIWADESSSSSVGFVVCAWPFERAINRNVITECHSTATENQFTGFYSPVIFGDVILELGRRHDRGNSAVQTL